MTLAAATLVACGGRRAATAGKNATATPVKYTYRVVNVYPHDRRAYTQGLFWHDGRLWESTGLSGQSSLREIDLETGRTVREAAVENEYFAEGAAILDGRIYQLTWQDGVALVWDAETLEVAERHPLPSEGWGLTTDGKELYMSDGSSRVTVMSPDGLARRRSVNVRNGGRSVRQLNELEWIDGRIWANIYMSDQIAIIDPATGNVEGIVDLAGLLSREDRRPDTDVLNGIAYDSAGGRIFVTGKFWPKIFEIELVER